jgi:hypothetical protein
MWLIAKGRLVSLLTTSMSRLTVVVPRLIAAGADLTRVHILKCIRNDKQQRQFTGCPPTTLAGKSSSTPTRRNGK